MDTDPTKLVYLRHFLLKCLYQAKKVGAHVYVCVRGIDTVSFSTIFRLNL